MSALPSTDRRPQKVALLVGSNPLPNFVAATVLSPSEVVLLYSPETQDPRDHLRTALSAKGIGVTEFCIDDATNPRKIQDVCKPLQVDHLHYSGGTKPMAAHARAAVNLTESQASYLDERRGLLRFDNGYDVKLSDHDLGLTVDVLLQLHGCNRKGQRATNPKTTNGVDIDSLASGAFHTGASPSGSDGRWLEDWVAKQIRSCIPGTEPEASIHCERCKSRREFEIDVALVRGHRLFVVSCTTSNRPDRAKAKLFEVAMRARQMGGDLARSALVSFVDGNVQRGQSHVELLRADIVSVWDAPNVPRVFGLADLREWAGTSSDPNLCSLKEWLDS